MESRYTLLLAVLILASTSAWSQSPTLVTIRLSQPPPNQVRIADLWKVELNNRSGRDVRVYLHGTAEELSIPDGLIVEAFTRQITLPPGISRITGNNVQPIRTQNENRKYRDVLLATGSAPTGEYRICCEVIEAENDQLLGLDCKQITVNRMTVPVLIAPPEASDVPDRLPVFSWMPSMPPGPGQRIFYEIRVAEMFGKQTPQDAILRNPLHLKLENLTRTVLQYPISARTLEVGRRYAWMVVAWEDRSTARVNLGESEIWWFTFQPLSSDEGGTDSAGRGTAEGGKPGQPTTIPSDACPGDNWDFELGTLACWTPDGDAWLLQPVKGMHPVLGDLGQHRDWWVTSYAVAIGDKARGTLESEEFQLRTSGIGFLAGGNLSADVAVELLVEKQPKDTLKLESRKISGSSKDYWLASTTSKQIQRNIGKATAGMSERMVPVEWDVRQFLNRSARIVVVDKSTVAHINVDHFRFYDIEKADTIKQPVLAMAAGELHSLAVTAEKKPSKTDWAKLSKDAADIKGRTGSIETVATINETTMGLKGGVQTYLAQHQQSPTAAPFKNSNASNDDVAIESFSMDAAFASESTKKLFNNYALAAKPKTTVVWGWGSNATRQIAGLAATAIAQPRLVPPLKNIEALAAGMAHSLFVDRDNTLYAVGLNDYYQLGIGPDNRNTLTTPAALQSYAKCIAVSAGHRHSLALSKNGVVMAWGYNGNGELGFGVTRSYHPTSGQVSGIVHAKIPYPQINKTPIAVAIAAGGSHSALLDQHGQVWCWGVNLHGQCGRDNDTTSFDEPVVVSLPLSVPSITHISSKPSQGLRPVAISCGDVHSMALLSNGTVRTWGSNASGQLGDGTTKDSHKPVTVQGLSGVRAIAAGGTFSLALDSAGVVWAWGNNGVGQLGTGDRVSSFVPVQVERLDAITGIVAGGAHAMAVRLDGSLWTWGLNNTGQRGEGAVVNLAPVPADPPILPLRVEKLAVAP